MFRWVLARSCFFVMEICLAESGIYASGSMFLGRWATVRARPKKDVSQIGLAFEEHGWQDLQRSPLAQNLAARAAPCGCQGCGFRSKLVQTWSVHAVKL